MIRILLVTSPACHLCEQAKDLLGRLTHDYPMRWHEIDMTSEEGEAVVRRYQVPFAPVLFVNDQFHSHGRVSEKKLRRALDGVMEVQ